jgi:hypothetical protein
MAIVIAEDPNSSWKVLRRADPVEEDLDFFQLSIS